MIFVSHQLPVNVEGQPRLDRAALWDGLVMKANNALPFVPAHLRLGPGLCHTHCRPARRAMDAQWRPCRFSHGRPPCLPC